MTMNRQAARATWIAGLRFGLSALVLAASGVAGAQYFFRIDVPPISQPNCYADGFDYTTPAALSWNLGPPPDNVIVYNYVNGVPFPPGMLSYSPPSGTEAVAIEFRDLPPAGTPYRIVLQAFPAIGRKPTGAGAAVVVQCNALGAGQGSATFSAVQAPSTVVEYYHAVFDHYFITWMPNEIAILDAGAQTKGWVRTGSSFKISTIAQTGTSPVCRYYIPPALGDSHFFGRGTVECNETGQKNPSFVLEDPAFMHMFLPAAGVCPANTTPIYRVFSAWPDANHRYMTDRAVRDQMVLNGWLAEGDGPDLVVMCAPL
jgi:hypothetical protein